MEPCKCIKEGDIASLKENLKILHKRIDGVENINKSLNTLTTSVAVMAEQMQNTNSKLDTLTKDVNELKEEDSKEYKYYKRQIIGNIILMIISAVGGAILAIIIKGGA